MPMLVCGSTPKVPILVYGSGMELELYILPSPVLKANRFTPNIYMGVLPETKISTLGVLPQTNIGPLGVLPQKNRDTLGVIYSAKSCPRFTPKTYLGVLPEIKISTLGVLPECLYWLCGSHILDLYILSIPLPVSAF